MVSMVRAKAYNSQNYNCFGSNEILLTDIEQQVYIVRYTPGAKSAIYDCLV